VSETLEITLHNRVQAWADIKTRLYPALARVLQGGATWVLTIKPATRSGDQNRKLHAMLGEIAAQKEWAGSKRDSETWKRLLTAAWTRARGEHTEFLPAIDGVGIDVVFRRTSSLTRGEMSELIEFVYAWGAEAGVLFTEIDPETGEILSSQRPAYRSSDGG
jgi:hypothetical protein